jgi:F-type H+-transporting ATPase subunit b
MDSVKILYTVAFVTFLAAVARPLIRLMINTLDGYAVGVGKKLDDAKNLHEEAQILLESYKKQQKEQAAEMKRLIEQAERDASFLQKEALEAMDKDIAAQKQRAMEKITRAEQRATQEIRAVAIDLALKATEQLLRSKQQDSTQDVQHMDRIIRAA